MYDSERAVALVTVDVSVFFNGDHRHTVRLVPGFAAGQHPEFFSKKMATEICGGGQFYSASIRQYKVLLAAQDN
jgi:hypothetical protein